MSAGIIFGDEPSRERAGDSQRRKALWAELLSANELSSPESDPRRIGSANIIFFLLFLFGQEKNSQKSLNFYGVVAKAHIDKAVSNLIPVIALEQNVTFFRGPATGELAFQFSCNLVQIRSFWVQAFNHCGRLSKPAHL
jgi:hypothetical protein